MKIKRKNINILTGFIIVALIIFVCFNINLENIRVNATNETNNTKIIENLTANELHQITRINDKNNSSPTISVLTHGWGGSAAH